MLTEHDALVEQITTTFASALYGKEFDPFVDPEDYDHCEKAVRATIPLIRTTDAARIAELESLARESLFHLRMDECAKAYHNKVLRATLNKDQNHD